MVNAELRVRETAQGLEVALHVVPRAKEHEISGVHNGALKVKVKAPPVDDAANRALIGFFSDLLGIPKSRLHILSGSKSRNKLLQIQNLPLRDFLERIPLTLAHDS
jgi:uncharacterized protein (TIGR00251 family)